MNGYNLNQELIREVLQKKADTYDPPSGFRQNLDSQIMREENKAAVNRKRYHVRKVAAAAALACAMTGTVCMAAGRISIYYSTSSALTRTTDFADISRLEKKTGIRTGAQETLDNGFVFENANITNRYAADANDNVVHSFQEISVLYVHGGKSVDYSVCKADDIEEEQHFTQEITSNGVTYYFTRADYLFVPDGYKPTAEERTALAAGDLFISTTGDAREEQVCVSLTWRVNGQRYLLSGEDPQMGAKELIAMAEQMEYERSMD